MPPTRARARDDAADAADAEFARAMTRLRARVDAIGDKATRIRCRAWIRAFERPERCDAMRRNRLELVRLLSAMLRVGRLRAPFSSAPPEGRLRRFDPNDAVGFDLDGEEEDGDAAAAGTATGTARGRTTETMNERREETRVSADRDAKTRVKTLEAEVKRLRAKTRTQEERIETLTRRLAGERESRSGARSGAKKNATFRRADARARTATAAAAAAATATATATATARHRSPPTSVPSDFDAYIDGLVAETARFRATLAGARA